MIHTETVRYEPWSSGPMVGYRVTRRSDGAVAFIYFNPSTDEGDPDVFVYAGRNGDPAQDGSLHYYDVASIFDAVGS